MNGHSMLDLQKVDIIPKELHFLTKGVYIWVGGSVKEVHEKSGIS